MTENEKKAVLVALALDGKYVQQCCMEPDESSNRVFSCPEGCCTCVPCMKCLARYKKYAENGAIEVLS
jgi:hypothetical protein